MKATSGLLIAAFGAGLLPLPLFSGMGDYDANGWTILIPSHDSRIVYVSSSEGDDINDGLSPASPKQTIDAANALIREGYPDWLLLKRGDTFANPNLGGWKSGRSADEPLVMSYYGDAGPRPVIRLTEAFITWNQAASPRNHTAFVGLDLYNPLSDPNSPDFANVNCLRAFSAAASGADTHNFLLEDCVLRYCWITIQSQSDPPAKIRNVWIRRNVIRDTWAHNSTFTIEGSLMHGMFVHQIINFYMEENLFHHNGWNAGIPDALPNQYNHNVYMSDSIDGEILLRGNLISYGAANGVQLRSGGTAVMNAFVGNAVALNIGYAYEPIFYTGDTYVEDNVFTDGRPQIPGDTSGPQTGAIWGIWRMIINNTYINDNIVANILNTQGGTMRPYNEMTPNQYGEGNIGWNWVNNNFPSTNPGWTDPSRNAAGYVASIGMDDWQDFIEAVTARPVGEMHYPLTAYAYVNYIREGFDKDPVTPPWFIPNDACTGIPVTSVGLDTADITISTLGDYRILNATVEPADACNRLIVWSTDDTNIATVDQRGVVTALSPGTTTLYATTDENGLEATCTVTVTGNAHFISNVAAGKPATADSNHNASAGAAATVDGNNNPGDSSRWVSANTAWPHWLEIDLQETYTISRLFFWSGGGGSYRDPFDYILQYWDGTQWVNIVEDPDNNASSVDVSFDPVDTDRVRLYGTGGNDSLMRVFEVEIYGTPYNPVPIIFPGIIGATSTGNPDEYLSDWFGLFNTSQNHQAWIAHHGLGWLHTGAVTNAAALWLWSHQLEAWLYSGSSLFPWFMTADGVWMYYHLQPDNSTWLFNTQNSMWEVY